MFPNTTQYLHNYCETFPNAMQYPGLSLGNVCKHYAISYCDMFPNTKQYPELSSRATLGALENVSKHYAIT